MTENLEPSPIDDYEANVSLTYDYIEKSIKEIQDTSNNINNKFLLLATFNLTYIRFFLSGLPKAGNHINYIDFSSYDFYLFLKIIAYVFSVCSIALCFVGLYSNTEYFLIPPKLLVNECDRTSIIGLKLAIIETQTEKIESFITLAEQKKKFFNYSMILFMLSALMAIITILINTFSVNPI
ncbi:MAG: hypothetical protein AAFQ80_11250 [Cyanobacteria bacterium J06621_8]